MTTWIPIVLALAYGVLVVVLIETGHLNWWMDWWEEGP